MIRYWGAILFTTLFVVQFLWLAFPYVEYAVNKTHIIEVLCVNKKDANCKGKCYLNQQIKKQQKDKEQTPANSPNTSNFKEFNAYLNVSQNQTRIKFLLLGKNGYHYSNIMHSIGTPQPPSHPPESLII